MPDIPNTIGYDVERAATLLEGYKVIVEETSTPFEDKINERKENTPVVVRQLQKDNCIILTVAKFK